jgi:uncharacterized phage protein gp47/JayE
MLFWSQIVEVTHDQAKQSLLNLLDGVGFTATSWQEGSIPLAFVEIGARIWSDLSKVAVTLKRAGFNSTAEGEGLTRFSASHYDNHRQPAQTAQRLITLSCIASEGPHSIGVGDVVIAAPQGQTFRNVEGNSVVYPATLSSGGTLQLLFEAEVAGASHTLGDGALLSPNGRLVTTYAGVEISADIQTREGRNVESDERLRRRNETKWALLTSFELIDRAVEHIVLTAAPGIESVAVNSTNPRGPGTFDVHVAGSLTVAGDEEVELAHEALQRYVMDPDPANVVWVRKADPVPLTLAGTVYHDARFDSADVKLATEAALVEFIRGIPLGGFDYSPFPANTVPKNNIEAAITAVAIGGTRVVKTVVLNVPTVDLPVPSFGKVVPQNSLLTWPSINYVPVTGTS